MAKFGESDPRWLVQDMGESGKNVNGWHWTEKDIKSWTRQRLTELLVGAKLASGQDGCTVELTALDSVDGDCILNFRKKKLIVAYELDIKFSWTGERRLGDGGAATASGQLLIPYLSEENSDEDPEVRATTRDEGADAEALRQALLTHGKQKVHEALRQLVQEMHAGGPEAGRTGGGAGGAGGAAAVGGHSAKEVLPAVPKPAPAPKPAMRASGSGRTLSLKETFAAAPRDLYECFTNAQRVMAFTQAPAECEPVEGGRLTMFGGTVSCTYRELVPAERIVMDWRFNTWEDGAMSKVILELTAPDVGTTVVQLTQSGIPEEDRYGNEDVYGNVETGWHRQIFHRIKAVFGYGI